MSERDSITMTDEDIKRLASNSGFEPSTQSDGSFDLDPHLYDFAYSVQAFVESKVFTEEDKILSTPFPQIHDTPEVAELSRQSWLTSKLRWLGVRKG